MFVYNYRPLSIIARGESSGESSEEYSRDSGRDSSEVGEKKR
jgi:hypothetical protein